MVSPFDGVELDRRLFFPRSDRSAPPAGAADRFVPVAGGRLHLREHAAAGADLTILLFHGNGEVVADYDDAAPLFAAAGAALAVVDYRGYGQSDGKPTLRAVVEDAHAVAAAFGQRRLIVMGRSLGSAAAAELYRASAPGVVGFIWESGFVDLDALLRRRGFEVGAGLPDEERRAFDPIPKLRQGRSPLLVLHGARDDLIHPSEARAAFGAAGTTIKELVLVPGHGHNDLSESPVYWQAIAAFVEKRRHELGPAA
jgi:pimeloyl-ACP methyl ester carboxylesterase